MLGCDLHCGYCQNWVTSQALRHSPRRRKCWCATRSIKARKFWSAPTTSR
jgi:pyruvate-formate lyase-activating enzyme